MKTKKLFFYLLAGLLVSCVPVMSLHPLYTEKDVIFEEKLLGTWVQDTDESIWEFSRVDANENTYKLTFSDNEDKKGAFVAHLVKLENRIFLDLYPEDLPSGQANEPNTVERPYNVFFFMPVHTFLKVSSIEPQLKMQLTDDEELEKLLQEDPNAVEYTSVEDILVLTASTKELQEFVIKYADDSRVFSKEIILNRKKNQKPKAPGKQDPNQD
ncbi:MAG: hypothetical protein ACYS0I_15905 [Planctomycetota bacterium]|jgi:hypothetical protein